eukprot:3599401-Heterocapsa_arctica.AAC.1
MQDVFLVIGNKACVHNMMALADGRLVPHGKHADLYRRAIKAMEDSPPRTIGSNGFLPTRRRNTSGQESFRESAVKATRRRISWPPRELKCT